MNQLKNITDEIIQNKKELSQSEKIYGKLFNTFSDGVYILDKSNYQILDANPSACNIYGYSLEEIRELKVTDLSAEPKRPWMDCIIILYRYLTGYIRKKTALFFP